MDDERSKARRVLYSVKKNLWGRRNCLSITGRRILGYNTFTLSLPFVYSIFLSFSKSLSISFELTRCSQAMGKLALAYLVS